MHSSQSLIIKPIRQYLEAKPGLITAGVALIFTVLLFSYRYLKTHLSGAIYGDSVSYAAMVHAFASGIYSPIAAPFNQRILAPWLASILAANLATGFILLNALAALLFVSCWFAIARLLQLRNAEFWLLILWFMLHPLGLAFYTRYPILVDPLCYALMCLVTLLFIAEKRTLLWLTISLALLVKESFVFISLVIAGAELVYALTSHNKQAQAAMISACVALFILFIYQIETSLIQEYLFPALPKQSTIFGTILDRLHIVWHDPKLFIVWLGAICCVTGVFAVFILFKQFTIKSPSQLRLDTYFILGGMGFIVLGLTAGNDISRIIFNGNLFIIPALLLSFRKQLLPLYHLLIAWCFSILLALNYTKFFPAMFEYNYYKHHQLAPTVYYIMLTLALIAGIYLLFKKFPGKAMPQLFRTIRLTFLNYFKFF